jgi:hypothetical protein
MLPIILSDEYGPPLLKKNILDNNTKMAMMMKIGVLRLATLPGRVEKPGPKYLNGYVYFWEVFDGIQTYGSYWC